MYVCVYIYLSCVYIYLSYVCVCVYTSNYLLKKDTEGSPSDVMSLTKNGVVRTKSIYQRSHSRNTPCHNGYKPLQWSLPTIALPQHITIITVNWLSKILQKWLCRIEMGWQLKIIIIIIRINNILRIKHYLVYHFKNNNCRVPFYFKEIWTIK